MIAGLLSKRNVLGRLFALMSALWLASCDGLQLPVGSGGPALGSGPVKVALLVPGGSLNPGDVVLARNLENAARMAIADQGADRIDLKVYNTAGSSAQAAQVASAAINEGAKVILGPLYKEAALSASSVAAQRGVPVLSFSNTSSISAAAPNLYLLGELFESRANRLIGYASAQGITRLYIAHADTPAGQLGAAAIRAAIARSGAQAVGSTAYPLSQIDLLSATDKIASEALASGAQAVVTTAGVGAELAVLATSLPEKGLSTDRAKLIGLTKWDTDPGVRNLPGLQGGLFAMANNARLAQFDRAYRAAHGVQPHPLAALSYDGMSAIAQLVKSGRGDAFSGASLTRRSGFAGASGAFRLLPGGLNERALSVATFQNGEVLILSPAPGSFGLGTN